MKLQNPFFLLLSFFLVLVFSVTVQANGNPKSLASNAVMTGKVAPETFYSTTFDSLEMQLGHCQAIIVADTNCTDHTIKLSAFVYYVFTGQFMPMEADWNTGQRAHQITVVPPGTWSWDPFATGCETNHWHTEYQAPIPFFTGTLDLDGPTSICPGHSGELTVLSGGYNFADYDWSDGNPGGGNSPHVISAAGTHTVTVTDFQGCRFTDEITLESSNNYTETNEITLCLGDTFLLNGIAYTQPGTLMDTLPSLTGGCDTIVTYVLSSVGPIPSNLSITCPSSLTVYQTGSVGAVVNYDFPVVETNCTCPGSGATLSSGLTSGSVFPQGVTTVCYNTSDGCGQSASCCFHVNVSDEGGVCDIKENGCIQYELLSITQDAEGKRTYRVRVKNNCAEKLLYTAIQVPNGVMATDPVLFSTYTAPSGNTYRVRNPSYAPWYSVRFTSLSDSIHNGESDIFRYTLPAQADVTFIRIVSRLAPSIYLEAHMNTFFCPIGTMITVDSLYEEREVESFASNDELLLYPNPASQIVQVETGGQAGELILQDAMGRIITRKPAIESGASFSVEGLAQGLYRVVFVRGDKILYRSLAVQR